MARAAEQHHSVEITVNNRPVEVQGPKISGLEIKQAAIDGGIPIELNFVLSEEIGPRKTRIVGDKDVVTVNKNSKFIAVAPDDNS